MRFDDRHSPVGQALTNRDVRAQSNDVTESAIYALATERHSDICSIPVHPLLIRQRCLVDALLVVHQCLAERARARC
jgi:hypothetical protein